MLISLISSLRCPCCGTQETGLKAHVFRSGESGHVHDGVIVCAGCHSWYPIEDELLELVKPELQYPDDYFKFASRFSKELAQLGLRDMMRVSGGDVSAQQVQRKHFDWYAGNEDQTYNAYQKSPFWTAFDAATFADWKSQIKPGTLMLDVGCADGRSCFPFSDSHATIIGFDISKALVRQAIRRAAAAGMQASTSFFVADASALPFRDETVDYVVIYGVLHHVPDPAATCREVYRVMKPDGVYLGSENNVTVFRWIFDLLMKLKPIWTEEAGEQPLISMRHIEQWMNGLPVSIKGHSSVFVPPQLINVLGHKNAPGVLAVTDKIGKAVPLLREQGGLIVFEVRKQRQTVLS